MSKLAIDGGEPVRKELLPMARPWVTDEDIAEVVDTLKNGYLTYGPKVKRLEGMMRGRFGRSAVMVSSCTAALVISLRKCIDEWRDEYPHGRVECYQYGLRHGDVRPYVITTPFTYVATASAIMEAGGMPLFADIDPSTFNISPAHVGRLVAEHDGRIAAIVPVHFAGLPCDMDALDAQAQGVPVVEDAAHAIGSTYDGLSIPVPTSRFGCFSFYPTKHLASGDAGAIVCNDGIVIRDGIAYEEDEQYCRCLLHHGSDKRKVANPSEADVTEMGYKANSDDLTAALLMHQFERLDRNIINRRGIAKLYQDNLPSCFERQGNGDGKGEHVFHLFTVLCPPELDRDQFIKIMRAENIQVSVHYGRIIPGMTYYRNELGTRPEDYPVALDVSKRIVSLPMSPQMREEDAEDVIDAVRKIVHSGS